MSCEHILLISGLSFYVVDDLFCGAKTFQLEVVTLFILSFLALA